MAPNDAEMAARQGLGDDVEQISRDLAGLREDLKWLTDDVKRLGSHQVEDMQAAAAAALDELGGAVRRNPLAAVTIALGAGFLYGVLTPALMRHENRHPGGTENLLGDSAEYPFAPAPMAVGPHDQQDSLLG
jgi:ElaB/YqjD/DUF883 family membrane-anchored ribosome-binding protein